MSGGREGASDVGEERMYVVDRDVATLILMGGAAGVGRRTESSVEGVEGVEGVDGEYQPRASVE